MAEAPKSVTPTKTVELVTLQAVYGRIQHPFTLAWFDQGAGVDHVMDVWVKSQMEAGKLVFAAVIKA